ncbi:hypothetical protein ALI144C_52760 [Actinosynnema sp. ALI-1.44]|uniref:ATP-binding protein n=1 Tax=Actinosynnema sp. ALI-1.44 TaxID=1933779 RepID=UPI00097C1844|nr:tetratricopeptide repeat protein [Actinosynnema sp. ALI-1.44]ONI71194.1 hypothetical protein ALI144C_52760 [Actinosynnema sp. ALI-1.44]
MDSNATSISISGHITGANLVQAGSIGQVTLPMPKVPIPRQLPPGVRGFAGRARELAELDTATMGPNGDSGALAVVEGMGGVGKTSLVIHWARQAANRFPDGTLFTDLRGYGPSAPLIPAVVLAGFIQALGVPAQQMPADEDAVAGLYRSLLADRRVLVVLDNAASAEQVRPLIPGADGCAVVVTSRASLTGLRVTEGVTSVIVSPMPTEDAVALVRGVVGSSRADAEGDAVTDLVKLCGGLPLAMRVAACRASARRHGGIARVVAELADERERVEGLSVSGDKRTAVQAVFAFSYHRLTEEQARVFRLLGMHPGPEFGVPAIAALTGIEEPEAARVLENLADLHLVEPVDDGRYRLHDLLHAYAVTRAEADEPEDSRRRAKVAVVTWYAQVADAADRVAFPTVPRPQVPLPQTVSQPVFDRDQALAWLDRELPALSAAARVAYQEGAWAASVVLAGVHHILVLRPRALWPYGLPAETAGVAAARAGGFREAEALLLQRVAESYRLTQAWAEADACYEQALRLGRALKDAVTVSGAICGMGRVRLTQQRYEEALEYYLTALPISREAGQPRLEAVVECNLSEIRLALGQHQHALEHAERELVLRRQASDQLGEAYALYGIAAARWRLGEHQAALNAGERAVALYSSRGPISVFACKPLELLASIYLDLGHHDRAIRALKDTHSIMAEFGDPRADEVLLRLRRIEAAATPGSTAGGAVGAG